MPKRRERSPRAVTTEGRPWRRLRRSTPLPPGNGGTREWFSQLPGLSRNFADQTVRHCQEDSGLVPGALAAPTDTPRGPPHGVSVCHPSRAIGASDGADSVGLTETPHTAHPPLWGRCYGVSGPITDIPGRYDPSRRRGLGVRQGGCHARVGTLGGCRGRMGSRTGPGPSPAGPEVGLSCDPPVSSSSPPSRRPPDRTGSTLRTRRCPASRRPFAVGTPLGRRPTGGGRTPGPTRLGARRHLAAGALSPPPQPRRLRRRRVSDGGPATPRRRRAG